MKSASSTLGRFSILDKSVAVERQAIAEHICHICRIQNVPVRSIPIESPTTTEHVDAFTEYVARALAFADIFFVRSHPDH